MNLQFLEIFSTEVSFPLETLNLKKYIYQKLLIFCINYISNLFFDLKKKKQYGIVILVNNLNYLTVY